MASENELLEEGPFASAVRGQRVAVLCPLAKNPILLDVLCVDDMTRMMKVKTVMSEGEGRAWWLSLSSVLTVAVVPKEVPLVQIPPSGIILT